MKVLRPPKRMRVRFDKVAHMTFGGYNLSFLQRHLNPNAEHHYTVSYSFARREFDLHLTLEKENKHHSLLKISEANLMKYLDIYAENLATGIKGAIIDMRVAPGLERYGFFENIVPDQKRLKELIREFGEALVESTEKELNFITEDKEVLKRAMGLGKYKRAYALSKHFTRVGYPLRLWNFRSAMVSYSSLYLWILAYDKTTRRMRCIDLNKVSLEDLFGRALADALGGERLADLISAVQQAPQTTRDLPPDAFAPGFLDLR